MNLRARLALAVAGLAVAAAAVSGCVGSTPAPSMPTPSATGFATAEEAYAAAEKTYRDYIEAENLRAEGRTGPDPLDYLSGAALDEAERVAREDQAAGRRATGRLEILDLVVESGTTAEVVLQACLDMSSVHVVNQAGEDVTPPERPDRRVLRATQEASIGSMKIHSMQSLADRC